MARKMKDSGIEWIGEIPEGWELTKVKRIFDIGRGRVISQQELTSVGYPVYSSQTKNNGCLGYISTYDFDKSQLTWTTDGVNAGTVFLREGKYNCTNVCGTLAPKNDTNDLRYLKYALEYIAFYHKRADINGFKIMNNEMAEIELLLPPLFEQQNIANYLDFKCSQTQSILEQSLFSIEEYKKLKQAVITQAVTKTIYDDFGNPSKFRKLRSLCDVLSKGTTPKDIETQNDEFYCIRYLKSENIVSNQLNLNPTFFITAETNNSLERSKLNSGDILFVIAGASIGKVAITTADFLPANTNQAVAFIRLSSSYQYATKYIWYFLQSDVVKQLIALSAVQSAQPNLSLEDLGAMRLPLPDQMGCLKITDYLDAKCAEIDKLIAKKEQLVKELESYKKSLIYEVVTGKREV
jgi:type I restriction enzyme S subunit